MTFGKWLVAVLVSAALATPVFAQGELGRFSGTVRDSSGATVADAKVTVKNERTGEERSIVSNGQGYYLIAGLKPSVYTIRAERSGFANLEYTQLPLVAGQEFSLDLEFKPAGVQESVTVTASSPIIDLSSAKLGVNVGEREVEGLPVNGR